MLSVHRAHGWALSWAGPELGIRSCRLPLDLLRDMAWEPRALGRGLSTLAPLCEPRPGTLRPVAASLSLPPSCTDFGLPHPHPSAFCPPWSQLERSPLPSGEGRRQQGLRRGPWVPCCVCVTAGICLLGLRLLGLSHPSSSTADL